MTEKKKQPEALTDDDLEQIQGGGSTASTTNVSKNSFGSGLNGVMPGDHVTFEPGNSLDGGQLNKWNDGTGNPFNS